MYPAHAQLLPLDPLPIDAGVLGIGQPVGFTQPILLPEQLKRQVVTLLANGFGLPAFRRTTVKAEVRVQGIVGKDFEILPALATHEQAIANVTHRVVGDPHQPIDGPVRQRRIAHKAQHLALRLSCHLSIGNG